MAELLCRVCFWIARSALPARAAVVANPALKTVPGVERRVEAGEECVALHDARHAAPRQRAAPEAPPPVDHAEDGAGERGGASLVHECGTGRAEVRPHRAHRGTSRARSP